MHYAHSSVNHQCSVHPIFQRVTYHRFFEKIQIYCFLILCGILPLLVTRDITTWKECVIDLLSIHNHGENIFNVNSKVNIVQLTCLKQPEHECNVLSSLMTSCMQPVTTTYRYMAETAFFKALYFSSNSAFSRSARMSSARIFDNSTAVSSACLLYVSFSRL